MYDAAKQMIIEHISKKLLYPIMPNTPQAKIFISHRSTDKAVADALCDLIQSSFRLQSHDIICTSVDAHGIENGKLSYHELKQQLVNANLVIYLLSEAFCQSEDCHYEIAWGFDLETSLYFHLDGVTSEFKPNCVVGKSMWNIARPELALLMMQLERSLSLNVDKVKWAEKVEKLMKVYEEYSVSKSQRVKSTISTNDGQKGLETPEVEESLATKIDRFNNHTTAVFILDESVQTSEGKKYKDDLVYLPDNEAKILIDTKKAGNPSLRVFAYQVIKTFDDEVYGPVQPGDILPFVESYIRSRERSFVIRLRSARDVIDVKNLDTDTQLRGGVQPWTMTAVNTQWRMSPLTML